MFRYAVIALFLMFLCFGNVVQAQITKLEVSAYTFSVTPKVGTPTASQTGHNLKAVYGDLKSTVFLFKQDDEKFCLFTSPFPINNKPFQSVLSELLGKELGIPYTSVILNTAHCHTIPYLNVTGNEKPDVNSPTYLSWELGQDFLKKLKDAAGKLEKKLKPVTVEWGVAEENRITYNRKGVYLDGKTYFMREEDRLEIAGKGYRGLIDPDASVVLFKDYDGNPVAALTSFTGHPVAAYNPENMISYGQVSQRGPEILSDYLGGIPVGFVQGCAGNINCKYMLTGTIEESKQLGEYLGETFILAANSLHKSKRMGFEWSREYVKIPFSSLPDETSLQNDLDSIDDFIKRGNAGDENTFRCVGMNFPRNLTPPYRAKLVDMVRHWYVWALDQYKSDNLRNLPEFLPVEIIVARFGDVGFVGMPAEAFVQTGLKIKKNSNLPCVLTCGYTDGNLGYIPDSTGVDDREYMSGFFRYAGGKIKDDYKYTDLLPKFWPERMLMPYKAPGGDAMGNTAIEKLNEFAR